MLKVKLFLWMVLSFFLYGYANAQVAGIPIANCIDLKNIALDMTANYYLMSDLDCAAEEANPFRPIEGVFIGTLNGHGHAISHIDIINENGEKSKSTGLFRELGPQSKISNIDFHEISLIAHDDALRGLIAGTATGPVEVHNVHIQGLQILRYDLSRPPYLPDKQKDIGVSGGIFGLTTGDVLLDDVHIGEEVLMQQNAFVGGLIGAAQGHTLIVRSSATQLRIQGGKTCDNPQNECGFGGLIGLIGKFEPSKHKAKHMQADMRQHYHVKIHQSYAKGSGISHKNMGGLVGLVKLDRSLQIRNSYSTVDITCGNTGTAFDSCKYAGGIIGQAKQGSGQQPISLENVYAAGLVDLDGDEHGRAIIGHGQQAGSTRVKSPANTQSYFDTDTTQKQHSGDKVSKGLPSVEMQVAAPDREDRPFFAWDGSIWFFKNGYYP
ncbi:MAG TPA: hypothetical protein VI522_00795, partial [Gammaproteobacteria bacterium]|nr:hypothetical protein [Gammaproteobacteria bacterium]